MNEWTIIIIIMKFQHCIVCASVVFSKFNQGYIKTIIQHQILHTLIRRLHEEFCVQRCKHIHHFLLHLLAVLKQEFKMAVCIYIEWCKCFCFCFCFCFFGKLDSYCENPCLIQHSVKMTLSENWSPFSYLSLYLF